MNDKNPKGAGRKPIIGGKIMQVIATPEEIQEIKNLLKLIRNKKKNNEI